MSHNVEDQLPSTEREDVLVRGVAFWTAVIVPFVVFGISIYASWAFVSEVVVEYLLNSNGSFGRTRTASGAGLTVAYFVLLFAWYTPYFRILQTLAVDPGFIPLGSADFSSNPRAEGLAEFYRKDAFIAVSRDCVEPKWCATCQNWKPDRTHHCSEVNRCVRKMDHYCPWVGGVVGETTYKFFLQFLLYAFAYCAYVLTATSVYMAERTRLNYGINPHWIVIMAFSGLFTFFLGGMLCQHLYLVLINVTTIENLNKGSNVYWIAFRTEQHKEGLQMPHFITIATEAGQNPWDLGPMENLKAVMGRHWYEMMFPVHNRPDVSRAASEFPFSRAVEDMKKAAGLGPRGPTPPTSKES